MELNAVVIARNLLVVHSSVREADIFIFVY